MDFRQFALHANSSPWRTLQPREFYQECLRRTWRGKLFWAEAVSALLALVAIPVTLDLPYGRRPYELDDFDEGNVGTCFEQRVDEKVSRSMS
jgi:hypothetical protein